MINMLSATRQFINDDSMSSIYDKYKETLDFDFE